jgi:hypothetical protein
VELPHLQRVPEDIGGDVKRAVEILQFGQTTLYRRLKRSKEASFRDRRSRGKSTDTNAQTRRVLVAYPVGDLEPEIVASARSVCA